MSKPGITLQMESVYQSLDSMISNVKPAALKGFFMRYTYPTYKNLQRERWKSENTSETGQWKELTELYEKRKISIAKTNSYPGGGTKLMILSGKLVGAATGGKGAYAIASGTTFTIGIDISEVPYAGYASEKRPIMQFTKQHISDLVKPLREFMLKGK